MNTEYWELRALGRNYEDTKKMVVRVKNRIEAMHRAGHHSREVDAQLVVVKTAKDEAEKIMKQEYRRLAKTQLPELFRFQQDTTGIGESFMAQLVGVVGDFRTYTEAWWEETSSHSARDSQRSGAEDASSQDEPDSRSVPEKRILQMGDVVPCGVRDVWAYCGHGDPARRRRKGGEQDENFAAGNVLAKTIVHLMSEFALRNNGVPDKNGKDRSMTPYYPLYVRAKAVARERHPDWTAGHADMHAKRLVGKAILKDIWRVQHGQEPVYGAPTPWTDRRAA